MSSVLARAVSQWISLLTTQETYTSYAFKLLYAVVIRDILNN